VNAALVELVNHKADDLFASFGDHSDAISLSKASYELFFRPREFKAGLLDLHDRWHVSPNHPADMTSLVGLNAWHNKRISL
jgi:hypothetical protein